MKAVEIPPTDESGGTPLPSPIHPPRRILLVDDEICMRQLGTEMLTHAGYEVDAAADGAAGWDALRAKHYDLLITDNVMPKVSGIEMVRKLRGQDATLPVILASAASATAQLKRHPSLQISAILLKPYTAEGFLETVKDVLKKQIDLTKLPHGENTP